jgi:hypothetical protein
MTKIPPFGCDVRGASAEQKREFLELLKKVEDNILPWITVYKYWGVDDSGEVDACDYTNDAKVRFTRIISIEQGIAILKGEEEPIKVSAREKLDEYAELRGLDRNQLIGWSIAADFAEWFISNCNPPKQ